MGVLNTLIQNVGSYNGKYQTVEVECTLKNQKHQIKAQDIVKWLKCETGSITIKQQLFLANVSYIL